VSFAKVAQNGHSNSEKTIITTGASGVPFVAVPSIDTGADGRGGSGLGAALPEEPNVRQRSAPHVRITRTVAATSRCRRQPPVGVEFVLVIGMFPLL
jgi:hypothetical protein